MKREVGVRDLATTLLDALGLLLVAGGVVGALWTWAGWGALAGGGVVVLAGSWLSARGDRK